MAELAILDAGGVTAAADWRAGRAVAELLTIAAPTVAQMASYTAMGFIDTVILSRFGGPADVTPATAAANGGLVAFSVVSLGMGVMFVVNTLVSQAFGRGDERRCGRYLWQGVWFSIAFGAAAAAASPVGARAFGWMGHERRLASLEGAYVRVLLLSAGLKLAATAGEQFLLGVDRPAAVGVVSVLAVGVNTVFAWGLILGRMGFAPHGVAGSAWAQNIGVTSELAMVAGVAAMPTIRRRFGTGDWWPRWEAMAELLRVGVPSGVMVVAEVLAWSAFSMWVMAPFGTGAMAANTFVFRYMSLSFMPAFRRQRGGDGPGRAVHRPGAAGPGGGAGEPGVRADGGVHAVVRGGAVRVSPAADRAVHGRGGRGADRVAAAGVRGGLPAIRRDVHRLQRRPPRGPATRWCRPSC